VKSVGSNPFWGMDTDEGNSQEPLSLHKYLYADADPVDGLDPSGHDDIAEMGMAMSMSMPLDTISIPNLYAVMSVPGLLRLIPESDDGRVGQAYRNVVYKVRTPWNSIPQTKWYVTEHQTDWSVAKPNGMSEDPQGNQFEDLIGEIDNAVINTIQTFTISTTPGVNGQPSFPIFVHANGWGDFGSLGIYISPSLILINGRVRYPNVNQ